MDGDDNEITRYLERVSALILATPRGPIQLIAKFLHRGWQNGATILTCGNGGSAATASHFAGDVTKATRHDLRKPVRAVCLSDNITALTAWANDTTYGHALCEQLRSLGRPGDVFLPISGSGNSPNVLEAAVEARRQKMLILALVGSGGGQLAGMADVAVVVPSDEMPAIEDVHMSICHVLVNALREAIAR